MGSDVREYICHVLDLEKEELETCRSVKAMLHIRHAQLP